MTVEPDRIYRLLPGVIRLRDDEQGYPLRDLLRVVGEQADLLEDDIRRLYDNLFIETCEQWVVPYIGDLLGYRPLHLLAPACDDSGARRSALLIPRRDVADTLALRRRKGTLALLEDLAAAVAGWPARVEESGTKVLVHVWRLRSYPLTRVRPFYLPRRTNCYTFSVLGNDAPLYTQAEPEAQAFALAQPHNIPQPLTIELLRDQTASFYGEGKSLCLYENGRPIDASRIVAQDLSNWEPEVFEGKVAVDPLRGRFMVPERYRPRGLTASYHYGFSDDIGGGEYPRPRSSNTVGISLFRSGHLRGRGVPLLDLLRDDNSVFTVYLRELFDADLLARLAGADDAAAIDRQLCAELNRIMQAYDLSAGPIEALSIDDETARLINSAPRGPRLIRLNRLLLEAAFPTAIARSFALVSVTAEADRQVIMTSVRVLQESERPPLHMVVELADSGLYVEPVVITLPAYHTLELRAADGCRPTIVLPERSADIDDMVITCGAGSSLVLDGLMVSRHAVRIVGDPAEVIVRHCTLVPGWELDEACEPCCGEEPSLVLSDIPLSENGHSEDASGCPPEALAVTHMCVERSIVGTILVQRDEVGADPVRLSVSDSIVDATSVKEDAVAAPNERIAHAILCIARSTVIGITRAHAIELGENSIFNGHMEVARRQLGCLRFCYVPVGSRTPRRYACQPDLAIEAATGGQTPEEEAARVAPKFMDPTLRYGKPNYCRLADDCAIEILQGADDESEMGVYHDLYQPQRAANLAARLSEYLPLGWQLELSYED
jgi:hypothetical protein